MGRDVYFNRFLQRNCTSRKYFNYYCRNSLLAEVAACFFSLLQISRQAAQYGESAARVENFQNLIYLTISLS